ncbi:glutathionylspermidine synthase family protein [Nibricoccus sp. IMCC34717]|uniref:glutathionylspermidine synthase family protein n=1 Tax=Nibricoccus sp. IMCC34717 TaxID=3034021 RepID=UPI00384BEF68
MKRESTTPRSDWRQRVEEVGLTFHSHETGPYWDESACYRFSLKQVLALESATKELHQMCIQAADTIVTRGDWHRLSIPELAIPSILESWERDDPSLYGRFDLAWDGVNPPKLLEYNADTPTSLVEAAVAQWYWLQECKPGQDQFNSIHERLVEAWKRWSGSTVHFCSVPENVEDEQTVVYLGDTALQAGCRPVWLAMEEVGWDSKRNAFVDLAGDEIKTLFKLYPWEWLWQEPFASKLPARTAWVEPLWKMLLSNKGLLPVLWEQFPGHPNLLPAFTDSAPLNGCHVRKPLLSREGANVCIVENGTVVAETQGDYGAEGWVYQAPACLPDFGGNIPVIGSWIIDHEPAGMGIREDHTRITGNLSRFVPHYIA